jgi:hypothetical protein
MSWRTFTVIGLATLVAACAMPKRPSPPPPSSAPNSVEGLASAIQSVVTRSDHAPDGAARARLSDQALTYADRCMAIAAKDPACLYGQALALGLQAKAHPTSASASLKAMLDALSKADAGDPNYDQAGPARVRALVLLRAPGWPLGPGDADAGLASARRAVELHPEFPPNQLALGEALAKTGDANGSRQAYERARDEAASHVATEDRDGWLHEANEALQRK